MARNGFIYKLCIRDGSIPECYIGSTFDLKQRRLSHRKDFKHKPDLYVYRFIAENGGIDNWTLVVLEHGEFPDKFALCAREREYIESHKPELNLYSPMKTATVCEHGIRGSQCKDCGGASICEHNRRRNACKDCGGAYICEHNRQRNQCKDCGGASICEHNRLRNQCKDCGGASICEHNRQRNKCKDCGGASICEHNRQRNTCKDCSPEKYAAMLQRQREAYAAKRATK